MDADDFIRHVELAMPTHAVLEQYGLTSDEIRDIQSTFSAPRRELRREARLPVIERMLSDFDCSRLEIGFIRFNQHVLSLPGGSGFAVCEADPLVVAEDGTIERLDHAPAHARLQQCASSAETFLDALAVFVTILAEKSAWTGKTHEAAVKCADAAGGLAYLGFFHSLCAFLDGAG